MGIVLIFFMRGFMVTFKAFAKINIALDIAGLRDDGYHIVDMIMQDIDLFDILSFEKIEDAKGEVIISLINPDPEGIIPLDDRNLITKAIKRMQKEFDLSDSVHVTLDKRIPAAAGMAGGSTDCAAAIKAVNELFNLNLSLDEMQNIGVKLGADVPYCLMGNTARAEGIGEILTKIAPMPDDIYYLIVKPRAGVSTKETYEAYDDQKSVEHPDIEKLIKAIENSDLEEIKNNMGNVLEKVTVNKVPVITDIEKLMNENNALISMMTGSGPTVFGIYKNKEDAEKAMQLIHDIITDTDCFVVGKPIRQEENI